MKRAISIWIKDMFFWAFCALVAWGALVRIYRVGFLEAMAQFLSEYGLVVLILDGMILGMGIWGGLYIDRINNDPPQNFSFQQAIQRHKIVHTWIGLIPGPAILLGVGGVFLLFMADTKDRMGSLLVIVFTSMLLFGIILNDLGKQYLAYLRKRSAPTAEEVLSSDQPPVLYLRSFIDDDLAEKLTTVDTTEEEEMSQAFQPFGPLIAIGQPGEHLPDLGAARAYFEDDEWQAAVQHYMEIASLVVLRAGFSRGLLWEIRNAVQRLNPQRFVLLIHLKREDYDRFREQVGGYFPKGLPDHTEYEVRYLDDDSRAVPWRFCTLLGVIHFDTDWTPHFEVFKMVSEGIRVYGMIRSALHPVYQKLGRTWPTDPREKSSRQKIIGYGFIFLVLPVACLLVTYCAAVIASISVSH